MYRSFTIKNFRGFHDFTLDSLERVNLIAGQNNVGKTALLEAIFLHIGYHNPRLVLTINAWRGIKRFKLDTEEVWGSFFYDYNTHSVIELVGQDTEAHESTLQIYLTAPETTQLAPTETEETISASITAAQPISELRLEYQDQAGQPTTARAFVNGDSIQIESQPKPTQSASGVFLSTHERFLQEEAERFSKLEAVNRQHEIVKALKVLEPRLDRLAILVLGRIPIIHGDVGIGRLLPVPMMGEGMRKLLSIMLDIASSEHGVILIDEIENGIHYSVMTKVWTAIAQAARAADVQIFATTHSWECITAAHQAFADSGTYDFRLHRLDRVDDSIQAVTYSQTMLDTAIKTGLEVR
jgi:AAA15 family ATPase/GTPase